MADPKMKQTQQNRASQGQSIPKGDTGDGATGVPAQEQGISNRPGDRDLENDAEGVIERSEDRLTDDEDDSDEDSDEDTSDEPESETERV